MAIVKGCYIAGYIYIGWVGRLSYLSSALVKQQLLVVHGFSAHIHNAATITGVKRHRSDCSRL